VNNVTPNQQPGRSLVKTYLNVEEVKILEGVADNLRDRLLVRLPFYSGCRISEALAISVDDIDFCQGTVSIIHLKRRIRLCCDNCGSRLGITSTFCSRCGQKIASAVRKEIDHRKQRVLPIDKETLELLREYIDRGGAVERQGKKLLFGINRHRAWQIIKDCAERAGLPRLINPETGRPRNVSPHRLRDAFAVHAMKQDDSGDGLRMLQEHLGHASFNTTARYRKVSGAEHRSWYEELWSGKTDG
jgi:integrase/recombinase XerD